MGDISEMMLDGTLCSICGQYIGECEGFPVVCPACQEDDDSDEELDF